MDLTGGRIPIDAIPIDIPVMVFVAKRIFCVDAAGRSLPVTIFVATLVIADLRASRRALAVPIVAVRAVVPSVAITIRVRVVAATKPRSCTVSVVVAVATLRGVVVFSRRARRWPHSSANVLSFGRRADTAHFTGAKQASA